MRTQININSRKEGLPPSVSVIDHGSVLVFLAHPCGTFTGNGYVGDLSFFMGSDEAEKQLKELLQTIFPAKEAS